ncbi:heterokaryon incompatibility protein-domain-containing protein [Hypoxylon crocopeplum]|nr:heterokaryon incompatibility protein-domain-containing protein [Hypoxylon crocopeplum]
MFLAFWIQYPLGTSLNWASVSDRIRITGVYYFLNSVAVLGIMSSLYWKQFISLFDSYFRRNVSLYREYCEVSQSRLFHISSFTVLFIMNFFFFLPVLVSLFVMAIAVMAVVFTLIFVVLVIWCFGLLTSFLVWFLLYRIPVYDLIYPRIRTWMLQHNSAVYHRLTSGDDVPISYIRLVCIKPGSLHHKLDCELITEDIATADFEALSYVWGTTMFPYNIKVNGKDFYVTYNLFSALHELRRPDRNRIVWIDALCINQADDVEKSYQVGLMKTIYSKASRVIVWLGTGSKVTTDAFNVARQFGDTRAEEDRNNLWTRVTTTPGWWSIRRVFNRILSHEWWTRAWIIQEVVVARRVVVQRGSAQLDWDTLQHIFAYRPFQDTFRSQSSTDFADAIQQLRIGLLSNNIDPTTLFDLVYEFRHQLATFGSDKIYAVLGLLPPGSSTAVAPDYSRSPEQVFIDFTLASIEENRDFAVVALAPGAALQGVSWCRDWQILNDGFGFNPVEYFSIYDLPPMRSYCTAGNSEPSVEADLSQCVLKVKGFELGVVAKRGECKFRIGYRPSYSWTSLLSNWERIAGGPWSSSSEEDLALSESFNRTIVADRWAGGIADWRAETEAAQSTFSPEEGSYAEALGCAGINRRFFVTQKGRFGLGPWKLKAGDVVVAVLGSVVPLVLRREDRGKIKGKRKLFKKYQSPEELVRETGIEEESKKEFWKLIGEAYCDGFMYYEGDINKDIQDGRVKIKDYNLR